MIATRQSEGHVAVRFGDATKTDHWQELRKVYGSVRIEGILRCNDDNRD